jgi:hypothetical protein
VRAGVTEFLKFAGIEFSSEPPPPIQTTAPPTLPDERVVSLDEARRLSSFEVHELSTLGKPTKVQVADGTPPRFVSLLYNGSRLDEFDGQFGPAMEKFTYDTEHVEKVSVNGSPALWINGPHDIIYIDKAGNWLAESAKMSGTTLIWQVGTVTMRLEGNFTKDEAIRIASAG